MAPGFSLCQRNDLAQLYLLVVGYRFDVGNEIEMNPLYLLRQFHEWQKEKASCRSS
jgi:hypothetical protein